MQLLLALPGAAKAIREKSVTWVGAVYELNSGDASNFWMALETDRECPKSMVDVDEVPNSVRFVRIGTLILFHNSQEYR